MSRTDWLLQVALAYPEVPLVGALCVLVVVLGLREPREPRARRRPRSRR